jgi:predicted dehydrogenase
LGLSGWEARLCREARLAQHVEGKLLVEASKKYKRVVQTGTQNRSNARIRKGIKLLHEGLIGDVYMARWLITGHRASIGFQSPESPPTDLHWDLWLGPAPEQPFHRNLVHYNWHWFWDFGNGEMGNNGTHYLDVARWGLNRGFPTRIQATGGRFGYKDQAQTPNTQTAVFQYDDGAILQAEIRGVHSGEQPSWWFYGSQGSMQMLAGGEFRVFWLTNKSPDSVRSWSKEMDEGVEPGTTGDTGHLANFYSAIRSNEPASLRAPITEGHVSCGTCLLGNIAYRVNRELRFDPKTEHVVGDAEADGLLKREYRKPYVVSDKV